MLGNHDIQLSRNFREKKLLLSRNRKKTFARVSNITCTAFAIKTPYKDLQIDYHIFSYIFYPNDFSAVPATTEPHAGQHATHAARQFDTQVGLAKPSWPKWRF